LEKELDKTKKNSALLQSKLEVQEMQAKKDDLVRKNKSLRQKNKGMLSAEAVEY
jgi:FtsZ-binding cell division protein ZapB